MSFYCALILYIQAIKKKTRLAFSFDYFLPPLTGALSAFSIASLIVLV